MRLTDLYETYETKLRRYALRLARDPYRADDLVQETFVRAMGYLDLLDSLKPYQQRAWLYRTCKNLYIDSERASQRQEALLESLAWEVPVAEYGLDEVGMPDPFALVPERYRDLVEMRYVLGMNSTEIGAHLGIPAATARSRLHLALKVMRARAEELR